MIKKIALLGAAAVVVLLFAVHVNAQSVSSQGCGSGLYACATGYYESNPGSASGVSTWSCVGASGTGSCQAGVSMSTQSTQATCGSAVYTCGSGDTPTNEGTQYCSATDQSGQYCSQAGGGDYYYWSCTGPSGTTPSGPCIAAASAGAPTSQTGGASCTSNSNCSYGDVCGSNNTCVPAPATPITSPTTPQSIACYETYNCSLGQSCVNPGTASSFCALPGNSANGNSETIAQAFAAANISSGAACTGSFTTSLSAAQACDALFQQEASALGYTTQCSDTLISSGAAAAAPYYNSQCSLTGNGLLGSMNGGVNSTFIPWAVVGWNVQGATEPTGSQSWQTVETGNGGTTTPSPSSVTPSQSTTGTSQPTQTTQPTQTQTSSGSTPTSSGNTTTQTTQPASVSTINSNLSGALSGFSSILSNINAAAQATPSASTVGSTGNTTASGGSTGTSTGGGTCASTAATTISSSLATLQGLATVLSGNNVSAGVLSSIQNLINAVAQVVLSLNSCIVTGGGTPSSGNTPVGNTPGGPINGTPVGGTPVTTPSVPTSMNPTSGPVGTTVTIQGDFTNMETILIGGLTGPALENRTPTPQNTLTFQIPQSLSPLCVSGEFCSQLVRVVTPGSYNVSVQSPNLNIINIGTFVVTSSSFQCPSDADCAPAPIMLSSSTPASSIQCPSDADCAPAPVMLSSSTPASTSATITPSSFGRGGQSATITGSSATSFSLTGNTVQITGQAGQYTNSIPNITSTGSSIVFTIPTGLTVGTYQVTVTTKNGGTISNLSFSIN